MADAAEKPDYLFMQRITGIADMMSEAPRVSEPFAPDSEESAEPIDHYLHDLLRSFRTEMAPNPELLLRIHKEIHEAQLFQCVLDPSPESKSWFGGITVDAAQNPN